MRAVTGWPDARDGKLLSIFEAMKRGLIADTRVIRLLEAQIATGGIIDPRQHHRVPINIAFRRGLFNKELNDKLEDTTDDTKGTVQKYKKTLRNRFRSLRKRFGVLITSDHITSILLRILLRTIT